MDRLLTRKQVEAWRMSFKSTYPETVVSYTEARRQLDLLCDLALSALSQEAVREEVLEEVAQMAQDRAASEHDDFSEFAHDVRALKREPNAAAQAGQGFSSAPSHEGHAAGPAPAAPDVASMVKQAEQNAQYWLKAGYEEPHRDLAVLNVEQAMNAYKNAMYALLARLGRGWISVSERLPNDETPVLILRSGDLDIGEIRWDIPGFEDTYNAFRYWDNPNNDGQAWEWNDITHWMPLPPAPGASDE